MSLDSLRLAIAEAECDAGRAAAVARTEQADLLVLPRLAADRAEASDGPLAHRLGAVAEEHGVALLFAYREACSGLVHAALQVVQADGRATANYRATHLSAATGAEGIAPGNWLTMTRLADCTLGLLGGVDHLAPEVARSLSAMGCRALVGLVDGVADFEGELFVASVRLRAIENGLPVCLVAGAQVAAATARGSQLPIRTVGGVLMVDLPLADAAAAAPRRPELYRRLVATV